MASTKTKRYSLWLLGAAASVLLNVVGTAHADTLTDLEKPFSAALQEGSLAYALPGKTNRLRLKYPASAYGSTHSSRNRLKHSVRGAACVSVAACSRASTLRRNPGNADGAAER